MIARIIALVVSVLVFAPEADAALTETNVDLPTCTVHVRVIRGSDSAAGPRFIMMDGVPLPSATYIRLAEQLSQRLDTTNLLIDFPGVGGTTLKGDNYGWGPIRECLRAYLATQPPHILVLSDLALPAAAPLIREIPAVQGLVIPNAVIRTSEVKPPFPLNFLRCCGRLAVAVGTLTPRPFYERRIRTVGIGRPEAVSRDEIRALYKEMRRDRGLSRLARVMGDVALDEETDRAILGGLAAPIPQLFVWGEADPVLGSEYKKLPPLSDNQRLIVLPEARHYLMIDSANEVSDAIVNWYGDHPALRPSRAGEDDHSVKRR